MKGKQIVAIDVGSTNVVMAVGSVEEDGRVDILGIASEPISSGINAGRIENSETVGSAVHAVKERLEEELGIKITEAYAGLAGDFIRCVQVTDHVYVQDDQANGCNQITERDIESLNLRMESVKLPDDREEIIAKEPLRYKADDKEVAVAVGAYGQVLTGTYNFILADKMLRGRMQQCLAKQDITVKSFVPNAFVAHLGVATTEDMEEGAIIINLGGGITDVTVLYNGKVRYFASIPIGMNSINGDIRAYGIPSSYVESLKINYGSAVCEMATDDKILFPHARRGTPKSIRRRNLARIIEERLKEICDWVKREIKEAGCGSRFSPVVLITGGGAEMQDIEQLFARELDIEEVRSVYPEYGFTDNFGEKITSRAYATIASLLLYGAKAGSCAVAVRQRPIPPVEPEAAQRRQLHTRDEEQTQPAPPVRPVVSNPEPPIKPVPPVKPATPVPPVKPVKPEDEGNDGKDPKPTIDPVKIDPVKPTQPGNNDGEDDIVVEKPKKKRGLKDIFTSLGDIFAGRDDIDTDGL